MMEPVTIRLDAGFLWFVAGFVAALIVAAFVIFVAGAHSCASVDGLFGIIHTSSPTYVCVV